MNRVNADLVGKVVNIASRCAGFINKQFDGTLSDTLAEPELYQGLLDLRESIIDAYIQRDYASAIRIIMEGAARVNQYIDAQKPWVLAKDPATAQAVQDVCSMGLNLFRVLMTYLKPVLPAMTTAAEEFLNCEPLMWDSIDKPLYHHQINAFTPLMTRVEQVKIDALLAENKVK